MDNLANQNLNNQVNILKKLTEAKLKKQHLKINKFEEKIETPQNMLLSKNKLNERIRSNNVEELFDSDYYVVDCGVLVREL
jgi:hypothetical protein